MPTYVQLAAEPVWRMQFVPPMMEASLLVPLRAFYGLGPTAIGAPGDNNHLYGRHRSYNWDKQSIYCTNRTYGTTNVKDQGGNRDWYRAVDVGIQGQTLFDASRRVDQLTRSGKCPGIAEWFGTFDGSTVVGWFEGRPSSSDDSHLFHLHLGIWNEFADDGTTMAQLYNAITGTASEGDEMQRYMIARDNHTGQLYLCDGMTSRPIADVDVAHIKTLAGEGLFELVNGGATRDDWYPGAFGPVSTTGDDGVSGDGATLAQVSAAVRAELDKTKLPTVPGQLGV